MKILLRATIPLNFNYYYDAECSRQNDGFRSLVYQGEIVELIKLTKTSFYLYVPLKGYYAMASPMIGIDRAMAEWFKKSSITAGKIWRSFK